MATETPEEKLEREAAEAKKAAAEKEATDKIAKLNAGKTGVGTRTVFQWTRGRSPVIVYYDVFEPDTMPKTMSEFLDITKSADNEPLVVKYLVAGFNEVNATEASDPIAEYVDKTWPEEVQKQFRLVVRNYANGANVSIEDAVALIKPGIVKSQEKVKA